MEDADKLAKMIVEKDLSVRQVEDFVAKQKEPQKPKTAKRKAMTLKILKKNWFKKLGFALKLLPMLKAVAKLFCNIPRLLSLI